jgi:hypothetical protein
MRFHPDAALKFLPGAQCLPQRGTRGATIGRRSRTGESTQDEGSHLAGIVTDPSQGIRA